MTPEEENQLISKLANQFILIPKNRLYYLAGGALAFLVVAFSVSIGSVMVYLRTEPAEVARTRIVEIRAEVERHYKDLGAGTFVRFGEPVALRSGRDAARYLNHYTEGDGTDKHGGTLINSQRIDPAGAKPQWTILRP